MLRGHFELGSFSWRKTPKPVTKKWFTLWLFSLGNRNKNMIKKGIIIVEWMENPFPVPKLWCQSLKINFFLEWSACFHACNESGSLENWVLDWWYRFERYKLYLWSYFFSLLFNMYFSLLDPCWERMVQQVPENINFPNEEEKILLLWKELNCFKECLKQSKNRPR